MPVCGPRRERDGGLDRGHQGLWGWDAPDRVHKAVTVIGAASAPVAALAPVAPGSADAGVRTASRAGPRPVEIGPEEAGPVVAGPVEIRLVVAGPSWRPGPKRSAGA